MSKDCPRRFDIRYMDFEERQAFAQNEFAALDVIEANEVHEEEGAEERED